MPVRIGVSIDPWAAKRKRDREEATAKMKLAAFGIPYTPEHSDLIKKGGTADDVVAIAQVSKRRSDNEARLAQSYEQPAAKTAELESTGLSGLEGAANRQLAAEGTPEQRQSIGEWSGKRTAQLEENRSQRDLAKRVESGQPLKFSDYTKSGFTPIEANRQVLTQRRESEREKTADKFKLPEDIKESYMAGQITLTQALAMKRGPKPLDTTADNRALDEIAQKRKLLDPAAQQKFEDAAQQRAFSEQARANVRGVPVQYGTGTDESGNPVETPEEYQKRIDKLSTPIQKQLEGEAALQIKEEAIRKYPKGTTGYSEDQGNGGDPEMDGLEAELQDLIDEFKRLRGGE